MKKFAALFQALILALSMTAALAEESDALDLSGKTIDELIRIINQARAELAMRLLPVVDGAVLYQDDNVSITLNGEAYLEDGALVLPIVLANHTNRNSLISFDDMSVNGWAVAGSSASVMGGKKAKDEIYIFDAEESADLTDLDTLTDVDCTVSYFDEDDYDWEFEGASVNGRSNNDGGGLRII